MAVHELAPARVAWSMTRSRGAEERIRADLARIVEVARTDRHLVALLLTGGFSRGEGTVRGGRPVNDYDLVAVRARPGTSDVARRVEGLGDDLGLHVDYMEVWRPRLRFVQAKLFWFDLRHGGRVLWGDPRVLEEVPAFTPGDLRPDEALRLLANRAAGLLLARGAPAAAVDVQAAKALLAVAEARLVVAGRYGPTVAERLFRFRRIAEHDPTSALALPWVERAAAFKLDPDAAPLDAADAWDAARVHLLAALPECAKATPYRTVERWLRRGTPEEAVWYTARSKGTGLARFVRNPTSRARRIALALLERPDGVPDAARRDLAAFGLAVSTWDEARDAALRVRACTLQ